MAPHPSAITALGWEMLESIPPFLRDDPDVVAVIHCQAREAERLEGAIEELRRQLNPLTATDRGLRFMEMLLRLPASGESIQVRRNRVKLRLAALEADPSGRDWIARLSARIGSGWAYEEHVPGDVTSPAAQTLRIRLPYAANSPQWDAALLATREETPAELGLVFISSGGFILDQSQMDVEGMGI